MANPEHSAIIKTFHGKGTAKDYLGELDEFLNESDEDDDEEEEEEEDEIIKRLDWCGLFKANKYSWRLLFIIHFLIKL